MDLFVNKSVFNPELQGKAVYIKGHDTEGEKWDRIFLVKSVEYDRITVVNCQGREVEIHEENFTYDDDNALKITLLEGQ